MKDLSADLKLAIEIIENMIMFSKVKDAMLDAVLIREGKTPPEKNVFPQEVLDGLKRDLEEYNE